MALQGPQGYHDFQWVTGNNPALTVVRKLGCGGYGKVYEVSDLDIIIANGVGQRS